MIMQFAVFMDCNKTVHNIDDGFYKESKSSAWALVRFSEPVDKKYEFLYEDKYFGFDFKVEAVE
jgi:hypothetical protein